MHRAPLTWLILLLLALLLLLWIGSDWRLWQLLLNTLLLIAGTCAVSLPWGTLLALLLARSDLSGRRLALAVLLALLFVPLYLQASAWNAAFGIQGWYVLFAQTPAEPVLEGWRGAIWVHGTAAIPWTVLILSIGLRLVEPELEEITLLDGSRFQTLLHVTLRRMLPWLAVAAALIAVTVAAEITVTDIFQVRTYAEELYTGLALGEAVGVVSLAMLPGILMLVVILVSTLLGVSSHIPAGGITTVDRLRSFPLGLWRVPASLFVIISLLLLIALPLGSLLYKAGMEVEQTGTERIRHWSVEKFTELVFPISDSWQQSAVWRFRREFAWTIVLGVVSAAIACTLALLAAWWSHQRSGRGFILLLLSALCLSIPGPLIALYLIKLLNQENIPLLIWLYDRTLFAPIVMLVIRIFPWMLLIFWFGLRTIPTQQLESAASEGAGGTAQLLRIVLPQRAGLWSAAWLIALAVATGELTASILVVPPGVFLLPVTVFLLIHQGVDDIVAALCLTAVAIYLILGALTLALLQTALRREVAGPLETAT